MLMLNVNVPSSSPCATTCLLACLSPLLVLQGRDQVLLVFVSSGNGT